MPVDDTPHIKKKKKKKVNMVHSDHIPTFITHWKVKLFLTPKQRVCALQFYCKPGDGEKKKKKKKKIQNVCKEMASFSLLKRYAFCHTHMEVKENAQE